MIILAVTISLGILSLPSVLAAIGMVAYVVPFALSHPQIRPTRLRIEQG